MATGDAGGIVVTALVVVATTLSLASAPASEHVPDIRRLGEVRPTHIPHGLIDALREPFAGIFALVPSGVRDHAQVEFEPEFFQDMTVAIAFSLFHANAPMI